MGGACPLSVPGRDEACTRGGDVGGVGVRVEQRVCTRLASGTSGTSARMTENNREESFANVVCRAVALCVAGKHPTHQVKAHWTKETKQLTCQCAYACDCDQESGKKKTVPWKKNRQDSPMARKNQASK